MAHIYSVRSAHPAVPLTALIVFGAAVLLVLVGGLAVSVGTVAVPIETVWGVIANRLAPGSVPVDWSAGREAIIWEVRLPRVLLGAIVGAALALVGAALQAVTRNPLADPHLLGISSGAALGAIVALLHVGLILGPLTVPAFAFAGALLSLAIVTATLRFTEAAGDAGRLVLAGVAVSFVLSALGSLALFLGDPRAAHMVVFWMLGGFGLAQWSQLVYPLAALFACGVYLFVQAANLNAMTLGDETATTLGLEPGRFRIAIFVACALLTGAAVAFSGVIAFVGLMIPHGARLIVGGDYRRVLPLSALLGAIFLVGADAAARSFWPPHDLPVGIFTGLVGGVFFLLLMRRRRDGAA